MIIDVHGHYTTAPRGLQAFRQRQIADFDTVITEGPEITDDEIRQTIEEGQLKFQKERGTDVALFSPTAGGMQHHVGPPRISLQWTQTVNNLVKRVCELFPENFVPVCQIPQSPGVPPENCIEELERCVNELGFVACNLNPDPSDGYWTDPPLIEKWWYPLYEKLVELEVPAMIHVSSSCNPNFHGTGAHYLNGDTTAFMQFIQSETLFKDFPTLRFVIPHGGGAVPYHWARYRGIAMNLGRPPLAEHVMTNVYFDSCIYNASGMEFLLRTVGPDNVLFASEMIGAVRGIDPEHGFYFDDTKRYVDQVDWLSDADRQKVYEGNAFKVYPRLAKAIERQRAAATSA
jgi:4-oxalmesaconate hydratase